MCKELLPALNQVDHTVPLSLGGADCWKTNMQILCAGCHAKKCHEELLAAIEGDELYTLKEIHEEFINPSGEVIFLCSWDGYPDEADWTWERASNLENEDVFHEYLLNRRVTKRRRK